HSRSAPAASTRTPRAGSTPRREALLPRGPAPEAPVSFDSTSSVPSPHLPPFRVAPLVVPSPSMKKQKRLTKRERKAQAGPVAAGGAAHNRCSASGRHIDPPVFTTTPLSDDCVRRA